MVLQKRLLAAAIASAAACSWPALADTVTFSASIGPSQTDWIGLLMLQKFNVAGGILDTAKIDYVGNFDVTFTEHNSSTASGVNAQLTTDAVIDLGYNIDAVGVPGLLNPGSELLSKALSLSGSHLLPVPAGGTASFNFSGSRSGFYDLTPGQLGLVQGPGSYALDAGAGIRTSVSGPSSLSSTISAKANTTVSITYVYHLGNEVAEPSSLALVLAAGVGGWGVRRSGRERRARSRLAPVSTD